MELLRIHAGLAAGVVAVLLTAGAALAQQRTIIKPNTQPFEVVGEVVDSWCCASKTVGLGRGPEHLKCAQTCILGGVTPAIIDDKGNMYVCAKTRAYQGANQLLYPFIAKKVVAKGWISEMGGCKFMKVLEVKEWKPGMKTTASAPATTGGAVAAKGK